MSEKKDEKAKVAFKEKFDDFLQRIKKIKHIEVIFCIVLIAIMLIVYAGWQKSEKTSKEGDTQSVSAYAETEKRLAAVLSKIEGAGKVECMITYDGTSELVTAISTSQNTVTREDNSGGSSLKTVTSDENTTPVMVTINGEQVPVVLKEINPKIVGVIIVAEGASDVGVRLRLQKAAATVLNLDANKIQIFTMNK